MSDNICPICQGPNLYPADAFSVLIPFQTDYVVRLSICESPTMQTVRVCAACLQRFAKQAIREWA